MAVAEFFDQYYSPDDLDAFMEANGLPSAAHLVRLEGPNDPSKPGGEASLDIQVHSLSLSLSLSLCVFYRGDVNDMPD